MNRILIATAVSLTAAWLALAPPASFAKDTVNDFSQRAEWHPPSYEKTRREMLAWINLQSADQTTKDRARVLWPATASAAGVSQLDRVAQTAAVLDAAARELVEFCSQPRPLTALPTFRVLASEKLAPLVRSNLRLIWGRWLAREQLYDEALEQLENMSPADVVDPAALLFYQAVVYHRLLKKDEALRSLDQLLSADSQVPLRYRTVAELMKADIEPLQDDSLDHIARRMDDVQRRLELGRAGKKVLAVEDGVIESLDKLIKKLEAQQKQQQQAAGGGGGSPAKESRILGGTGPGNVTKKDIGDKTSWGDLPPKKRREAMQQISKDYPPHYREIIEQYFKRLATEKDGER